jgi:hypothetical protein
MAASARASTSAGVSSGPMNATPGDAPTTSVDAPRRSFERGGFGRRIGVAHIPQQHDEFVAADARDHVGGAHVADKHSGDRLEHGVAGGVAMAIVDRLEVVEIEKNKRRARAVTLDVSERALEFSLEAATVERLGERIDVDPRLDRANSGARSFEFAGKPLDLGGKLNRERAPARLRRLRFVDAAATFYWLAQRGGSPRPQCQRLVWRSCRLSFHGPRLESGEKLSPAAPATD